NLFSLCARLLLYLEHTAIGKKLKGPILFITAILDIILSAILGEHYFAATTEYLRALPSCLCQCTLIQVEEKVYIPAKTWVDELKEASSFASFAYRRALDLIALAILYASVAVAFLFVYAMDESASHSEDVQEVVDGIDDRFTEGSTAVGIGSGESSSAEVVEGVIVEDLISDIRYLLDGLHAAEADVEVFEAETVVEEVVEEEEEAIEEVGAVDGIEGEEYLESESSNFVPSPSATDSVFDSEDFSSLDFGDNLLEIDMDEVFQLSNPVLDNFEDEYINFDFPTSKSKKSKAKGSKKPRVLAATISNESIVSSTIDKANKGKVAVVLTQQVRINIVASSTAGSSLCELDSILRSIGYGSPSQGEAQVPDCSRQGQEVEVVRMEGDEF
ncbi:hypothetical protein CPC08DRAFT_711609, partial [Agrocybe pediades]